MKVASKVFIILGMVFGIIFIYPLILGIFAINKLEQANSSNDLKAWGIVCILFVSVLGGIFMLCIKDSELQKPKTNTSTKNKLDSIDDFIVAEICDEL